MKNQTSKQKLLVMCEMGIMIALSAVLSLIVIWKSPWGGSVTLLSMLPIAIMSIRHGTKIGLATSFIYAVVQLGIGLPELMGWGMTPVVWVGCVVFDYIVPFGILGLAGAFRRRGYFARVAGVAGVVIIRYVSHVISGGLFFGMYAWEGWNPIAYSFAYNAVYMTPELIATTVAAAVLLRLNAIKKYIN